MSRLTGRDLCLAAGQRLEVAGIANGERDALLLFTHALWQVSGEAVKIHHRANHLAAEAPAELEAAFHELIEARAAHQPVSQIIGKRAFWNHDFIVTRDTLDPRPETETLVEEALKLPWNSVLDLGTGTGAILLSLMAERKGSQGLGTDISEAAIDVARRNAQMIGLTASFITSDWFREVTGRFDLIVSNPPYIAQSEMAGLGPDVTEWEPHQALTDGADGLTAYRAIAEGAGAHLNPGGRVLVEIGHLQGAAVTEIFTGYGAETCRFSDLDGRDRVISAQF